MPSFDTVSKVDKQEVANALNQAKSAIDHRYDLKGSGAHVELVEEKDTMIVKVSANEDFHLKQVLDIVIPALGKRGISPHSLKHLPLNKNLSKAEQKIEVRQGIEQSEAKKIIALLKDSKLKIQTSIQGDILRISGKNKDNLQEAMALLRTQTEVTLPLQFENFRD